MVFTVSVRTSKIMVCSSKSHVPSEENDDDGSSRHRDRRENEGPLGEMSRVGGWLRKITELFLACTIGLAVRPGGR